jgi:catechol 2,3-dioxygenase-like lactoylglutathione lyase family enzyme
MLVAIHPKLPMRDKSKTRDYYIQVLGFREFGMADFPGYLMLERDEIQLHFFEFPGLDPFQNYGQVYIRTNSIDLLYQEFLAKKALMPAAGHLETKPWLQREFSVLDPDHNLLTFGQAIQ